jgi:hypothetical protein
MVSVKFIHVVLSVMHSFSRCKVILQSLLKTYFCGGMGMVVHTAIPATWEVEKGGYCGLRLAQAKAQDPI